MSHTQSLVKLCVAAAVAAMLATALAGCGGNNLADRLAGQGIAVGAMPIAADFIAKAQEATCTDTRNRLFMIDKTMVFWDRAGSCADNAYGRTLYGATPQAVLCTLADSIAGPKIACAAARSRQMFDTIIANLDKADLGLGGGHQVEALAIPAKPH